MKLLRIIFLIVGLAGLGMIAGGVVSIAHKESGRMVHATVTGCHSVGVKDTTFQCDGTWVEGGRLVGGAGHVVLGDIDDATPSEVGRTIDVRASGDHAYTSSLRTPIVLLVLGALLALGSIVLVIAAGRQPPRAQIASVPPSGAAEKAPES